MHFRVGVGVVGKHCAARSFGFLAAIARARFHGKFLPGVCPLSALPSGGRGGMRGKNGDSSAENEKSHPLGRGDIDAGCKNILFHALSQHFFPSLLFPVTPHLSLPPLSRFISHLFDESLTFSSPSRESRRVETKGQFEECQIARDRERSRVNRVKCQQPTRDRRQ